MEWRGSGLTGIEFPLIRTSALIFDNDGVGSWVLEFESDSNVYLKHSDEMMHMIKSFSMNPTASVTTQQASQQTPQQTAQEQTQQQPQQQQQPPQQGSQRPEARTATQRAGSADPQRPAQEEASRVLPGAGAEGGAGSLREVPGPDPAGKVVVRIGGVVE